MNKEVLAQYIEQMLGVDRAYAQQLAQAVQLKHDPEIGYYLEIDATQAESQKPPTEPLFQPPNYPPNVPPNVAHTRPSPQNPALQRWENEGGYSDPISEILSELRGGVSNATESVQRGTGPEQPSSTIRGNLDALRDKLLEEWDAKEGQDYNTGIKAQGRRELAAEVLRLLG